MQEVTEIVYLAESSFESAYGHFEGFFGQEDHIDIDDYEKYQWIAAFGEPYYFEIDFHEVDDDIIAISAVIVEDLGVPEEDVEGEDHDAVERYPDSVIVDYVESEETYNGVTVEIFEIVYLAETTPESAFDHFWDFFEQDDSLDIDDYSENEVIEASDNDGIDIAIHLQEEEGVLSISVYIAEPDL